MDGLSRTTVRIEVLVSFKGAHYPTSVIIYAVYFYVRFGVSYRDLEEIMAERGIAVDHATLNRWVEKYAGAIADEAHRRKMPTGQSWRMAEPISKLVEMRTCGVSRATNRYTFLNCVSHCSTKVQMWLRTATSASSLRDIYCWNQVEN